MSGFAAFQRDFANALLADTPSFAPASHPAFAVYRNTVMRACLDALEANFPAVACLVGRDWFRSAAAIHVAASPPRDVRLAMYGESFADFLAGFEPADSLPYLADVARLDRLYVESLHAEDVPTLCADRLAALGPEALARTCLRPHPAIRWFSSAMPARTIWEASHRGEAVHPGLSWRPEQALVLRTPRGVHVLPAGPLEIDLLEACAAGATLAEATLAAATAHPDARVDLTLSGLLRSGAFATS
ncbi:putative DNA-binding domain-containing protein [Luteibacter sp. Lutesp34]|uniref:HvfC/BufC family peptide modification chaperone n=1 Tax=Luteibacter sp. Lutesp34 TaxID=3243030 RepID=UPI0039B5D03A